MNLERVENIFYFPDTLNSSFMYKLQKQIKLRI